MVANMGRFLRNITDMHRSGLIIEDSEELSIKPEGVTVCWRLKTPSHYKAYYFISEESGKAEIAVRSKNGEVLAQQSIETAASPVMHLEKLLDSLHDEQSSLHA